MSYASRLKDELRANIPKNNCCKRAMLLGMLVLRASTQDGIVRFRRPDDDTLCLMNEMIGEQFGKMPEVRREELSFHSRACSEAVSAFASMSYSLALKRKCQGCEGAFLRGVFISNGSMTDPERDYRMEISCGDKAEKMAEMLAACSFSPKIASRRKERLVYFHDSTSIEDFLAVIGGTNCSFDIMNSRIRRDMRNDANRVANCEANNIDRAVEAAARQIETIERLRDENKLSFLPPELEKTARLRLEYKELSLSQLAMAAQPPISKSGMNHRLAKIMELAEQLLCER